MRRHLEGPRGRGRGRGHQRSEESIRTPRGDGGRGRGQGDGGGEALRGGGAGAGLGEGVVPGRDLRRCVSLLSQDARARASLEAAAPAGQAGFGRAQWGDGAARGQHRLLLHTGGDGGGGAGGRRRRRQVDLAMRLRRSQSQREGRGREGAACCHRNLQLHHHLKQLLDS